MGTFGNREFRTKKQQQERAKSFMGMYTRLVKKNSFIYMGIPMMLSLVFASHVMTNLLSAKFERHDEKVKELDETEALKLATQKKRRVGSINDEYYRLQGFIEENKDYEPKRVKRLPGESENVW